MSDKKSVITVARAAGPKSPTAPKPDKQAAKPAPQNETAAPETHKTDMPQHNTPLAEKPPSPAPEKPAATEPTPEPSPARKMSFETTVAAGAVAVVFIAMAFFTLVYYVKFQNLQQTAQAQEQARQDVCSYAAGLVSYDYNNLDPYFQHTLDGATGNFKSLWTAQSKFMKDYLVKGQVKAQSTKVECGVKSGNDHQAQIVLAINQSASSVATKGQPQPFQLSIIASAEKVGNHWLISDLEAPGGMLPQ